MTPVPSDFWQTDSEAFKAGRAVLESASERLRLNNEKFDRERLWLIATGMALANKRYRAVITETLNPAEAYPPSRVTRALAVILAEDKSQSAQVCLTLGLDGVRKGECVADAVIRNLQERELRNQIELSQKSIGLCNRNDVAGFAERLEQELLQVRERMARYAEANKPAAGRANQPGEEAESKAGKEGTLQ